MSVRRGCVLQSEDGETAEVADTAAPTSPAENPPATETKEPAPQVSVGHRSLTLTTFTTDSVIRYVKTRISSGLSS